MDTGKYFDMFLGIKLCVSEYQLERRRWNVWDSFTLKRKTRRDGKKPRNDIFSLLGRTKRRNEKKV